MPIGLLLTMTAKPESSEELRTLLIAAVEATRTEAGNLLAVLMVDPADNHRFNIFEIYRDEEAIQAHRAAPHTARSAPTIHALFGAPMEVERFETIDWPATLRITMEPG